MVKKIRRWKKRKDNVKQRYIYGRKAKIKRIRKCRLKKPYYVAIPPNWSNVQTHEDKNYIITGVDIKGRTQYIYPDKHIAKKNKLKHKKVRDLRKKLPKILDKINKDIKKNSEEAKAVYTIYKTGFRPGFDIDTKADIKAFGAVNLKGKHVKVKGNKVIFDFIGKKGIPIHKEIVDAKLSKIIKPKDHAKSEVFDTDAKKVAKYFKKKTRNKFNLKDLRTLKAHVIAEKAFKENCQKKHIGKEVAKELGNTPAIALKSYIDTNIIEKVNGK